MSRTNLTITRIEPVRGCVLRFHFSDGHTNDVDFKPWIASLPTEEERTYLKPTKFKKYHIHLGHAIMWGDYDIIFPLVAVYHGDPDLLENGVPMRAPERAVRQRVPDKPVANARGKGGARVRSKSGKVKV